MEVFGCFNSDILLFYMHLRQNLVTFNPQIFLMRVIYLLQFDRIRQIERIVDVALAVNASLGDVGIVVNFTNSSSSHDQL